MILKNSPFSIKDKNIRDLDNVSNNLPLVDDLMAEHNIENAEAKTVHRRRDLDSLG
tara:strand:+ start:471 stop:638 length:168 start_codon:yes stop_codon:yes gene_type:complete